MKPALTGKIREFLSWRRLTIAIFPATCAICSFSWTERLRAADVDSVVPAGREPETALV